MYVVHLEEYENIWINNIVQVYSYILLLEACFSVSLKGFLTFFFFQ